MKSMTVWILLIVGAAALPSCTRLDAASVPASGEEFVGPFPSWANVRSYGALGDGTADDTEAIQSALNDLGKPGHSPILFIPSGSYRITRPLTLAFLININVIGEDPASTVLSWHGDAGGTMLSINGVAYSRFGRLTLDGRGTAGVAVDQSWDGSRPHFDTGNEYSDMWFRDVDYGIRGGFKGHGFAETSVKRGRFLRNAKAGIALGNFNALDLWVWYSLFEDCGVAVTNTPGAGNFRVYNSVLRRSRIADFAISNTGGFSARHNYSVDSRAFFTAAGTANPAVIHLQGNTIVDPLDSVAIKMGNQGPGLLTDNVVRSRSGAAAPVVLWNGFITPDLLAVGNAFTVAQPISTNGRLAEVDTRVIDSGKLRLSEPDLPEVARSQRRPVFEVAAGNDGYDIQKAIVAAARERGKRPIVHLPFGTYPISDTLTIPVGDIQIVGDGFETILRWTGKNTGPVIRILGPSSATLRDLQVDGAKRADGIVAQGVDQRGSRVYLDQVQLRSGSWRDLLVDRLDNTRVVLEDFGHAYSPEAESVKVIGGSAAADGAATAKTVVFSGAASGLGTAYDVSAGGRLLVRDLWYESSVGPGFAVVRDRAVLTVDGARVSSPANQPRAAFDINNLDGRVTLVATHLDDRVTISGTGGQATVSALGVFAEQRSADYFINASKPLARSTRVGSRHLGVIPGVRSTPSSNIGAADPALIRLALSDTRAERPAPLSALPSEVTDLRMFRVGVSSGLINIALTK